MEIGLVLVWLFAFLALGAVALPLSTWLLRNRSAGAFAMPVAVAVLALVGHLVGQVAFGWPAVIAGLAVLVAGSALAWTVGDATADALDWRGYVEAAAVFTVGFLLIVAIRGIEPSAAPLPLATGEKMLDFGLLATLERSGTLPPEDMWFAGETVLYHYGGHATTSLLSTLTGTAPAYAYNLGLAAFYGLLLTGAYGLAGAIAEPYDVPRRLAAGVGAFFVGLASNLHTPAQFAAWLLPDGLVTWIVETAGADPSYATWTPDQIGSFWYFRASRVMPVDPSASNPYESMAATEFPLFAWLNADLHAHMMSQPFMLLAAGILLAYWRCPPESDRRLLLCLGSLPPVAGLVGYVNLWSFPTAGGLALVAVAFAPGEPLAPVFKRMAESGDASRSPWRDRLGWREHWALEELRRFGIATAAAIAVLLLGFLWTLPYWFEVVFQGPSQSVGFWGRWSPLGSLILVHGAFLLAFVPYLAAKAIPELDSSATIGATAVLGFVAGVAAGMPAAAIFLPIGLLAWWLLRTARDEDFALALLVAGAGLVLLVELVTIEGERFNVIFKYYAHVWLFFGIAAGVAVARLAGGMPTLRGSIDHVRWGLAGRALLAVLLIATSVYGVVALGVHFQTGSSVTDEQGMTLNATAYLETEYPEEAPAIRWLDDREGQPTTVTAAPGGYTWAPAQGDGASAPASLTGAPTVLGWFHERQYRGDDPYFERRSDVETIYTGSPEDRRAILERYDVDYVYVGPAERNHYDGPIELGEDSALTVAREFEHVTIYEFENG